jgi:hypothetical protein
MHYKKVYFVISALPLFLFISCPTLRTRGAGPSFIVNAGIKIFRGSAMVKIDGKINENLYPPDTLFDERRKDASYYDKPVITEGTITKNETLYLAVGDEYNFPVLPSEVVTMNIISADGNDVEVIARQYGKEKKYTLKGTDKLGLFIAFQNR